MVIITTEMWVVFARWRDIGGYVVHVTFCFRVEFLGV